LKPALDAGILGSVSVTITEGVLVEVKSAFVPERSQPEDGEYFFAYTVRITNSGAQTVQLLSRHWIITDATGRTEEVRGAGVVGQQPILQPGQSFQYTSACPLSTPWGEMRGTYQMVRDDGTAFDARIATFELAIPAASRAKLLN
jgi:ApaG protein